MSFLKKLSKVAVLGSLITVMGSSTVFAAAFGVVSGNNVNIRSQASASSEILGSANIGTEFNVLGKGRLVQRYVQRSSGLCVFTVPYSK